VFSQATTMDARRNRRAVRDIKITYENLARADGSARFSSGGELVLCSLDWFTEISELHR